MRQTKYVPGYGYITFGGGFWQDAGKELTFAIGKKVANAIGDKIGQKIATKMVASEIKPNKQTREDVLKELELIPSNGLSKDVRRALYGSGKKHLI